MHIASSGIFSWIPKRQKTWCFAKEPNRSSPLQSTTPIFLVWTSGNPLVLHSRVDVDLAVVPKTNFHPFAEPFKIYPANRRSGGWIGQTPSSWSSLSSHSHLRDWNHPYRRPEWSLSASCRLVFSEICSTTPTIKVSLLSNMVLPEPHGRSCSISARKTFHIIVWNVMTHLL